MPWTNEQTDRLISMQTNGATAREIANALDMTRNAVLGKIDRLRNVGVLKKPKLKPLNTGGKPPKRKSRSKAKPVLAIEKVQERRSSIDGPPMPSDFRFIKNKAAWEALPGSNPITLLELTAHTCRWSVGPDGHPRLFCGLATVKNRPWCETHDHLSQPKF